jgi:hypothetical protein
LLSLEDVPKADRWITTIAVWQVVGGMLSIAAFLDAVSVPGTSAAARFACMAGCTIALFAVWSGFQLRKRRTSGLYSALVVQCLQLLGFSTGSTCLQLSLGPFVYLTLIFGQRYAIDFGMRPRLLFYINSSSAPEAGAVINLLALFCFVRLLFWEIPTTPTKAPVAAHLAVSSDVVGDVAGASPERSRHAGAEGHSTVESNSSQSSPNDC